MISIALALFLLLLLAVVGPADSKVGDVASAFADISSLGFHSLGGSDDADWLRRQGVAVLTMNCREVSRIASLFVRQLRWNQLHRDVGTNA